MKQWPAFSVSQLSRRFTGYLALVVSPTFVATRKTPWLLLLLANQSMSHSHRDPSPTLLGMFAPRSQYSNAEDPLTAALLGSIPRDETPAQRQQRLALEAEARRISDEIDERLRQERIERGRRKVVKVLLLGQSESGKSTTLRNLELVYAPNALRAEVLTWRAIIHLNQFR